MAPCCGSEVSSLCRVRLVDQPLPSLVQAEGPCGSTRAGLGCSDNLALDLLSVAHCRARRVWPSVDDDGRREVGLRVQTHRSASYGGAGSVEVALCCSDCRV